MRKKSLLVVSCLLLVGIISYSQNNKILFDASRAEMAGNADWVIDADVHNIGYPNGPAVVGQGSESNPQITPTPAQSGITQSTAETFWQGALSAWGIDCVKHGYHVETLPYNGAVTYGNNNNAQDLSHYKTFIVVEPNIVFTTAEKTALINFVQNGGSLFMVSDHTVSDRNNDGWDSPAIWNDLLTNNSVQNDPFGISFDLQNFSETTTNVAVLPGDSILHGPMGNVTEAMWSNGTSMTLNPSHNSSVKGVIYKTSSPNSGNTNVMCAYARYGNGKVGAIGDSSPCDDGTGDTGDALYNGYFGDANGNHQLLLMNITIWLMEANPVTTSVNDASSFQMTVNVFPNPSSGKVTVNYKTRDISSINISIFDLTGRIVASPVVECSSTQNEQTFNVELPEGSYILKMQQGNNFICKKILIIR